MSSTKRAFHFLRQRNPCFSSSSEITGAVTHRSWPPWRSVMVCGSVKRRGCGLSARRWSRLWTEADVAPLRWSSECLRVLEDVTEEADVLATLVVDESGQQPSVVELVMMAMRLAVRTCLCLEWRRLTTWVFLFGEWSLVRRRRGHERRGGRTAGSSIVMAESDVSGSYRLMK